MRHDAGKTPANGMALADLGLRSRAQDDEATIQRRLADSRIEIPHWTEFDHVVVNDRFEDAVEDLVAIVRARRSRRELRGPAVEALVRELLA